MEGLYETGKMAAYFAWIAIVTMRCIDWVVFPFGTNFRRCNAAGNDSNRSSLFDHAALLCPICCEKSDHFLSHYGVVYFKRLFVFSASGDWR